jgi:DNA/RNA endonuclease YhcR with UshA esterase domain
MKPVIGSWYRIQRSDSFEVVAFDEDDGTIELQYFDGTIEEMDLEDWQAELEAGTLVEVEPPEDWSGSVDVDPEENDQRGAVGYGEDVDRRQSASKLEGLDLFE